MLSTATRLSQPRTTVLHVISKMNAADRYETAFRRTRMTDLTKIAKKLGYTVAYGRFTGVTPGNASPLGQIDGDVFLVEERLTPLARRKVLARLIAMTFATEDDGYLSVYDVPVSPIAPDDAIVAKLRVERFALELLMPFAALRNSVQAGKSERWMRRHYGVTAEDLTIRLNHYHLSDARS